jgi:hypothetical protein
VSADLATARQKFQRAFAAEFLCPINSLVEYLSEDFSDTALEDAALRFRFEVQHLLFEQVAWEDITDILIWKSAAGFVP